MGFFTNSTDLKKMRVACQAAASVLDFINPYVKPGITTKELNDICLKFIQNDLVGAESATIGYAPEGYPPFPGCICTSVNHQVCHGIPGERILQEGDSLNIDVTILLNGFYGDTSRMFYVGKQSILSLRLSQIAFECMWLGIYQVKHGATLGDIGFAIQTHAEKNKFSVVREFCGHGIGRNFHENPQVLHYGNAGQGQKLISGMVFTIEPMINAGKKDIKLLPDKWSVVTKDHSLSAQWEHTVLVTNNGYEVLTVSPDMKASPIFNI